MHMHGCVVQIGESGCDKFKYIPVLLISQIPVRFPSTASRK